LAGRIVRLRSRRLEDAADEYRWRTDEEMCRLDATTPIDLTYPEFMERHFVELEYPGLTYTLAIDALDGRHIGNCSMFNFDILNNSAETGILIGEKAYWDRGYGSDALNTFLQHVFDTSSIQRVMLRTLDWNQRAQKCFEKCGFRPSGSLAKGEYNFILMEIRQPQLLAGNH